MRPHLVPLLALSFVVVTSGCAGLAVDPAPSQTPTQSPTTATDEPCTVQAVAYDIPITDRPSTLNETSATALVKAIERQYQRARIRAEDENVTISASGFREVSTEPIKNGVGVTVRFTVAYSTDRLTAKGSYPTTYRVTVDRLVRDGHTLACGTRAS